MSRLLSSVIDNIVKLTYNVTMHEIQRKILELASAENISQMGLREIGRKIGVDHPQKVKFHLEKLQTKGFLEADDFGGLKAVQHESTGLLISIPVLGRANCGEPLARTDGPALGYLKVSPSVLDSNEQSMFAIKAVGNSMNRAYIDGRAINDGDYVLVDGDAREPDSGDYVLASLDEGATLKKFVRNSDQIMLAAESSEEHPPIIVDESDQSPAVINGTVKRVISMLAAV